MNLSLSLSFGFVYLSLSVSVRLSAYLSPYLHTETDTWWVINLLTSKHPPANTSTTSGIFPDDLNNHFCSVVSEVIKIDNSPQ